MSASVPPSLPGQSVQNSFPTSSLGANSLTNLRYTSLRYAREDNFFNELKPLIEEVREKDTKLERKIEGQEEQFFKFLSHSVEISEIGTLPEIIGTVKENIGTDLPMKLFLTEFPITTAMAMPRFAYGGNDQDLDEIIILVSQHFMNELSDAERASILGHEFGHALLEHVKVPTGAILEGDIEGAGPELLANVLKWSVCCEVSCDLFGYIGSGGNVRASQTALLKYTTGLDRKTFDLLNADSLIAQVLKQYDSLASTVVKNVISTHPLTPLRIKLLETLPSIEILQHFGEDLTAEKVDLIRKKLSDQLDPLIASIYPELFEETGLDQGFILFYLGIATALADGTMDREEITAIQKMISPELDSQAFFDGLEQTLQTRDVQSVVEELVDRSIAEAKEKGYRKNEAIKTVKLMLIVAAADGRVDAKELKAIYRFCEHFDLSKKELVYLANQVITPGN
ncbi:MAG: TerB family tellurite resistance protein [Verrucomicrobiales bacterium]|nr:TerB family tellurite resistance protein [Verrucomicrobiales bacterium]